MISKHDAESLSDEDKKMMESFDDSDTTEYILTPEQAAVIDQKRERLQGSGEFAFRFVNSKEYYDLLEADTTPRQLETITEDVRKILGYQLLHQRSRIKPSTALLAWDETADRQTAWHISARAIFFWQNGIHQYKKIWDEQKQKGGSPKDARIKFADFLKENASVYLRQILDNRDPNVSKSLSQPTSGIRDEHREKLIELLNKSSSDFTKEDLRFLMRFYKGHGYFSHQDNDPDSRSGESYMPYEFLEIWPAAQSKPEINPWNEDMGFTAIPKNSKVSEMLGVVLLAPHDKDLTKEVVGRMVGNCRDNPGNAHLIINPNFYELYPQEGTDILPETDTPE